MHYGFSSSHAEHIESAQTTITAIYIYPIRAIMEAVVMYLEPTDLAVMAD